MNSTLKIDRGHVDHSRDEARQEARAKRVPVGGARDILTVEVEIPGKHLCWVNDDDKGNLYRYQRGGYEFVLSNVKTGETTVDRPTNGTDSVVSKNVGQGMVAYLMAIDQDLYDEDRAAEAEEVDEIERRIGLPDTRNGMYRKQVDIQHNKR